MVPTVVNLFNTWGTGVRIPVHVIVIRHSRCIHYIHTLHTFVHVVHVLNIMPEWKPSRLFEYNAQYPMAPWGKLNCQNHSSFRIAQTYKCTRRKATMHNTIVCLPTYPIGVHIWVHKYAYTPHTTVLNIQEYWIHQWFWKGDIEAFIIRFTWYSWIR